MADIQDNNNTHLFLNTVDSANNSFIANVNSLANKLQDVLVLNTLFNPKNVADLSDLAQIDITTLIEDLKKGSINDSRKLDIDLLRNFKDYDDKLTDEDKQRLTDALTIMSDVIGAIVQQIANIDDTELNTIKLEQ